MPVEGEKAGGTRAGDLARRDPPTCSPDEEIQPGSAEDWQPWSLCVVVDSDKVVHGLLTSADIASADLPATADSLMELGPATVRPSAPLDRTLRRMEHNEDDHILVTTSLGELLGVLSREEVEAQVDAE